MNYFQRTFFVLPNLSNKCIVFSPEIFILLPVFDLTSVYVAGYRLAKQDSDISSPILYGLSNYSRYDYPSCIRPYSKANMFIETKVAAMKLQIIKIKSASSISRVLFKDIITLQIYLRLRNRLIFILSGNK